MSRLVMAPRTCELIAALALAIAVIVIVVTPVILEAPNSLSTPTAMITGIGCAGALLGGRGGRTTALVVSIAGLLLNILWFLLASGGFGKGTPWVDDMVEAGILAAAFLVAAVLLLIARRSSSGGGTSRPDGPSRN